MVENCSYVKIDIGLLDLIVFWTKLCIVSFHKIILKIDPQQFYLRILIFEFWRPAVWWQNNLFDTPF